MSMTPESQLKREICQALDKMGIFWLRLNSGGYRGRMKGCPKGTSDLVAFFVGKPLFIETKATTKQSPEQMEFQARVESKGMRYIVAKSLDDVVRAL